MQTKQEYTKAVAAKLVEALKRDAKASKNHFAESIPDKQRRRKLEDQLRQVLEGNNDS